MHEDAPTYARHRMIIGVPKEIKIQEYRVGMTPGGVAELVRHGHEVLVETSAGAAIGLDNGNYSDAGASIVDSAADVFKSADLIVKIKEPQLQERRMLREGQTLFTYLHLAPDPDQVSDLLSSGATAIAYETVTDSDGALPLLIPMSDVAGRMAIQVGAHFLELPHQGRGILLGGVAGVMPAKVVIIGSGTVGTAAARTAAGMGADVVVLGTNPGTLNRIDGLYGPAVRTVFSTGASIDEHVAAGDLVVGAVLKAGAGTPNLISRDLVSRMKKGSVIVDVAIDQGGCAETSHATSHEDPTFVVDGVVHYCVANMPGAVARTSTFALTSTTLPYVIALADQGIRKALVNNAGLRDGLNIHKGHITCKPVADAVGSPFLSAEDALAI